MGKKVIHVTDDKRDALGVKKRLNASLKERGIKREVYVGRISKAYVKALTRKGYPVKDKNYAVFARDKR